MDHIGFTCVVVPFERSEARCRIAHGSDAVFARPEAKGVEIGQGFNGLGLRGNDSLPVTYKAMSVSERDLLTKQGEGTPLMLEVLLPWFSIGTAAMANGLCRAAVSTTARHLSSAGFEHTNSQLRDLPNLRSRLAEMSVRTEQSRALLAHTVAEMEKPDRIHAAVRFPVPAGCDIEAAVDVTDLAMKACGGAAFCETSECRTPVPGRPGRLGHGTHCRPSPRIRRDGR